jgi:hypothetical protein
MLTLVHEVTDTFKDGIVAVVMSSYISSSSLFATRNQVIRNASLEALQSSSTVSIAVAVALALSALACSCGTLSYIDKCYKRWVVAEIMTREVLFATNDAAWNLSVVVPLEAPQVAVTLIVIVAFTFALMAQVGCCTSNAIS